MCAFHKKTRIFCEKKNSSNNERVELDKNKQKVSVLMINERITFMNI